MFKKFFSSFKFLKLFFLIYKSTKRILRRRLNYLIFKSLASSILELSLILFSGSLAFLFLDDKNELKNMPELFLTLGINNLSDLQISFLFIFISITATLFTFYVNCELIFLSHEISNDISSNLFNEFMDIEYTKYTQLSTDNFQQSTQYSQSLAKNVIGFLDIVKGILSIILVSIGVLITIKESGIFLILLVFIIYLIIVLKTKKIFYILSEKLKILEGDLLRFTNTCYGGFRDIKFSNFTEYIKNTLIKKDREIKANRSKFYVYQVFPKYLLEILAFSFIGFILITKSLNINIFKTSFPELIIIAFASLRLIPLFQKIFMLYSTLKLSSAQVNYLFQFLNFCKNKPYNNYKSKSVNENKKEFKLRDLVFDLKNISYSYPNDNKIVLKNINLSIKINQWTVIQGATGSGKSTLLDILLGLLKPNEGEINFYFKSKFPKEPFQNISHVAQFPFLFIGDINKNIVGFDEKYIDKKIFKRCLYYSCLDDDLNSGTLNLKDNVGERGIKLSGGQRQRIGIARAIYLLLKQKRSILILDECTSALDEETSKKFISRLSEIKEEISMILVTHRTDLNKMFDKIYFIKNGSLIEKV